MSAAAIPLSFQFPRIPDPVQSYGQMLSLANLRQEMAQRAEMGPLQVQQAQLALQQAQTEASELARTKQIAAQTEMDIQAQNQQPQQAPTQQSGAPTSQLQPSSSLANTSAPEYSGNASASGTMPLSSLGAKDYDYDETPDDSLAAPGVAQPAYATAPSAGSSAAAPVSTAGAPASAAPAAAPVSASAPASRSTPVTPSFEQLFAQRMNAAGLSYRIAPYLQQRAAGIQAGIQAQQMQQQQRDQQIWNASYKRAADEAIQSGDYADLDQKALSYAAAGGMSGVGMSTAREGLFKMAEGQANARMAESKADAKDRINNQANADEVATRLVAFNKRPDDASAEGRNAKWPDFLAGLYRDKLVTLAQYQKYQQDYPQAPKPQDLEYLEANIASQQWQDAAATRLNKQKSDAAAQLGSVGTYGDYARGLASLDPYVARSMPNLSNRPANAPVSDADRSLIRAAGMTAEQQATNAATLAKNQWEKSYQQRQLDLSTERNNLRRLQINQSANAQKATVQDGMNQVWKDTVATMQGRGQTAATPQDAITFLKDSANWKDNPAVDKQRNALINAFQKTNANDLNAALTTARTQEVKDKEDLDNLAKALGVSNASAPAGGSTPPAAPPAQAPRTAPAPQAPPSTAPPTPAPRTAPAQTVAKVFPRARLDAFAAANHMTSAAAEAQLKAQGYAVQ